MSSRKKGKPASEISGGGSPQNEQLGGQLSFPNNESLAAAQVLPMSRGERTELQQLLRQRERVLKADAKQRSAELLADFEQQISSIYSYDQDAVWEQAYAAAKAEVAKAKERVAAQCAKLGIPRQFAPSMDVGWYGRGENAVAKRRDELRKAAVTRIAAIERAALLKIAKITVEASSAIAAHGMTSQAAKAFFDRLPPIEGLMPQLSYAEIAKQLGQTLHDEGDDDDDEDDDL